MIKYSENQIVNKLMDSLKNNSIEELYKQNFLNFIGKTSDTGEYYTEVIARELIINKIDSLLKQITPVPRVNYNVGHTGVVTTNNEVSNRVEERIAILLYNACKNLTITFGKLGEIVDYQVPLKSTLQDKGIGKIDLVSKTKDEIWLIELKYFKHRGKDANKKTLLKAALQISTYYQLLHKQNFLNSYQELKNYNETQIKKAILIFNENERDNEYEELINGNMPFLKNLLKKLDITIFDLGVGKV